MTETRTSPQRVKLKEKRRKTVGKAEGVTRHAPLEGQIEGNAKENHGKSRGRDGDTHLPLEGQNEGKALEKRRKKI